MSTDLTAAGPNQPRPEKSSGPAANGARGGFFSLYKPGQGYWTRMGTALGASAIILFIAWFVFAQTSIFLGESRGPRFGIAAGVAALLALLAWWLMNAPKRAQFLIDTDSEMKKVNWASWGELIGSTRIVVFFMVLTAVILFTFDTQYHALFFLLRVWHIPFDSIMGQITGGLLGLTLLAIGIALWHGSRLPDASKLTKWSAGVVTGVAIAVLAAWVVYTIRHPGIA